jgi:hypothetical protein
MTPEDQPTASGVEGQETTTGPTGQSTTGRKAEGQETVQKPGPDGQNTAYRPSDRPNR